MDEKHEKSWFGRNWMWAVPVGGCGCGCLLIVLFFVFGIGAAIFGVSKMIDNATPIEYAMKQVRNNEKVVSLLGDDIEKYSIPSGNISLRNNDGDVDFSIPIRGSKSEGTLIVKGIKTDGEWVYEDLYVRIKETQEEINLLENEKVLESI